LLPEVSAIDRVSLRLPHPVAKCGCILHNAAGHSKTVNRGRSIKQTSFFLLQYYMYLKCKLSLCYHIGR